MGQETAGCLFSAAPKDPLEVTTGVYVNQVYGFDLKNNKFNALDPDIDLPGWKLSKGETNRLFPADRDDESVKKWDIGWNEIENAESDGPERIASFLNERWRDLPARNGKAIPRITLIDVDPRVAHVEMGIQGKYAGQWGLEKMPEFATWLYGQFAANFKAKKGMVRNAGSPAFGSDTAILKKLAADFGSHAP